jgi:hypothetical protein
VAASAQSRRVKRAGRALLAAWLALAPAPAALAQAAPPPPAGGARNEAPPDVPAGDARIVGRVVRGSASAPVSNVEVVLYALSPDGTPGLRRATSGADGGFAFEGVSSRSDIAYLVGARYQDIPVPGGRVAFGPGEKTASADIRVADLTPDTSAVKIRAQTLRLFREAEGLRIEETFEIELGGDEIAFVPPRERRRRPPGLRATLPAEASDFQMPLGVIPEGLERQGGRYRYFGPFYPGMQDLSWSYRIPAGEPLAGGVRFRFEFAPAQGVETFNVLVPEGLGAFDAPGLANAGRSDDGGRAVTRFTVAHPSRPLTFTLDAPSARVDPSALAVHEVQIVLHADDAAIRVQETHLLSVSGSALQLGTRDAPLLRVPMPAAASDVRFGSEAPGLGFAPDADGGVAVTGSLSPGEVPIQIAYRVPVGPEGARLSRSFGARVALLRIYVADTGRLIPNSPRLHRSRPVRTEDLNYLGLEGFDLAAGEEVALSLDPLPPRGAASPTLARALGAAIGLGLLAWLALPLVQRGTGAMLPSASEPSAEARGEREALYQAIRDLDHDFETGKVSAEDRARLRDELRGRAAALLRDEEAGTTLPTSTRASEPAERACAKCGAPAASEHRFCASCGAPLGAPGA